MNAAMRSVLALAPFLLVHPTTISAAAQDRAKVNVVLNFAADGGAGGILPRSRARIFSGS